MAHRKGGAQRFQFKINFFFIAHSPTVQILGVQIDRVGRATDWMRKMRLHWEIVLRIIRRVTSKAWGAQEVTLRTLTRLPLESKALYEYNFRNITKSHRNALETVRRKAMRIITGPTKTTAAQDLLEHAQVNALADLA